MIIFFSKIVLFILILQDPENKQFFKPDKKMQPVFGSDNVRAFGMAKFLKTHLS
jgi:chromatin remodeling complex protein RSC6